MKKIITLLFAVAAIGTLQAQTSREEARKVVLGGEKQTKTPAPNRTDNPRDVVLGGGSTSTETGRQAEIDQINREYDAKIASIRNNPTLSQEEKNQAIARLERDRARKIRAIRNADRDDDYDDDDRDGNKNKKAKKAKKAKSNNGKKLGWEKGVGNPHKNGGSPKGKNKG